MTTTAQIIRPVDILSFVTAGNARFTLVSKKTGQRFTYRVRQDDAQKPAFVSVLTGPDNEADYQYLGVIFADTGFRVTRRSRISPDAPSARGFAYFWHELTNGGDLERLEFWHCGRCGRALTDPESIAKGIGPVCEAA